MAKWGEGDPRWIVEERADAKNVNNWHWTEKNATGWSKEKIKELLEKVKVEDDQYLGEITSVTKVEGEAVANNRKGKLIFFYEWDIEADWKGSLKSGDNKTKFKGKIQIPNLSEENDASELDVTVTCDKSTEAAHKVKEFMRLVGSPVIREALGKYITDLRTEYSKDLILPTKTATTTGGGNVNSTNGTSKTAFNNTQISSKSGDAGSKKTSSGKLTSINMEETFFCSPQDLFKVFTEQEAMRAFTRAEAVADNRVGGNFSLFGGNVSGSFEEINPSQPQLKLLWRRKEWTDGHFSKVTLDFLNDEGGAKLVVNQSEVPWEDVENTKKGWKQHYFIAIKQTFGYGGRMF